MSNDILPAHQSSSRSIRAEEIWCPGARNNSQVPQVAGKAHAALSRKSLKEDIDHLETRLKATDCPVACKKIIGRIAYRKTQLHMANGASVITKPLDTVLGTYKTSLPHAPGYCLPGDEVDSALGIVGTLLGELSANRMGSLYGPALGLIGQAVSMVSVGIKAGVRIAAYPPAKLAETAVRLKN